MQPDIDEAYWTEHARAGTALTLLITALHLGYVLATWAEGANRPTLLAINLTGLIFTVIGSVTMPQDRIARSPHRDVIFNAWCLGGVLLITVGVVLDGGMSSPLSWMFPVTVMITALIHRPALVVRQTVASCAGLLAVALSDGTLADEPVAMLVRCFYLVAMGYVATVAARSRWRQHASQVALASSLTALAERDALTGLVNHRVFHERLIEELARAERSGTPLSLLVVDLDHFKRINDRHGHLVGDAVLVRVAALLAESARTGDVVARVGGEEFCVLLPATPADGALVLAERVRESVASIDDPVELTVSVGVSTYPTEASTALDLFQGADRALYGAKRAGRNRVLTSS